MHPSKDNVLNKQANEIDHDNENQVLLETCECANTNKMVNEEDDKQKNSSNDKIKIFSTSRISKCEKENQLSIDDLLNKVGFNIYHMIFFLIVVLSLISDGVEIYLIYLIAPVLSHINGYSENFVSGMTSILFFGMAVGCILSGLISKYLGRKNGILTFLTLITIFGTFCVSINNIFWFMLCRFIVGISIGYLFNIVNSFCEILPIKYRDFIIGSIFFAIKLGIIYFIFIFYLFSKYFDIVNSYKTIVILGSAPMIICWLVAIVYFDESPRILLWNCEYSKAFSIIDRMNNGNSYDFNEEEKIKVIKYIESILQKEYCHLKKATERENEENNHKNETGTERKSDSNIVNQNEVENLDKKNKEELKQEEKKISNNNQSIYKERNKYDNISLDEKKRYILAHKNSWRNFLEIFRSKKLSLTILVCLLWSLNTLTLGTNMYSLPIILANQNKEKEIFEKDFIDNITISNATDITTNLIIYSGFTNKNITNGKKIVNSHSLLFNGTEKIKKILISNLVPLPAEFLAGYLTTQDDFGKKKLILLGFFFMSVCSLSMIIFPDWLYLFSSGINFFSVFAFNITKLYTSLVYHTDNRDFAYGLANFSSRIVSIFVPFFANFVLNINLYATCYVIFIGSVLGCFISGMLNENLCKKPIK